MEGLILFLVISVISAVIGRFNSKENAEKKKQMPSMGQGPMAKKTPTSQRLGDYAKKMAEEIEKPLEEVKKKREKRVTTPRNEPVLEVVSSRPFKNAAEHAKVNSNMSKKTVTTNATSRVLPQTQREIAQAIIMSEVLAPPVSKRK